MIVEMYGSEWKLLLMLLNAWLFTVWHGVIIIFVLLTLHFCISYIICYRCCERGKSRVQMRGWVTCRSSDEGAQGSNVRTQFVWRTIVELIPRAYRFEVLSHCIQTFIYELMFVVWIDYWLMIVVVVYATLLNILHR